MSEIQANKLSPASGTGVQLGDSGDTITIPSGATITNSGSSSGFAPAGINSASTSGTALQITSGNIVGAGADAANADLGNGLHVKIADSGGSVNANRSAIVVEGTGDHGMTILGNNAGQGGLWFANQSSSDAGQINYDHGADDMRFYTGGSERLKITDQGYLYSPPTSSLTTSQSPNVYINSGGTFKKSTSALKYKKDVRDLESIDINTLRPVRYKSNIAEDETNEDFIGFIADEFHDAGLTELVTYEKPDEEGNPVVGGFNYDRLTAVLTKALQDANKKIETLEARVQALESA